MRLPNAEIVEIATADGLTLRCRRYPRPGARAVVCAHGQASCGYEFDLPLAGFRLSEQLYGLGYEVWVVNFRGAGHIPWRSDECSQRDSGDHMGALDLPAIIDRVVAETGKPPFYIGHSFGGMSLYIYLQGAVMDGTESGGVHRDPEVARERNSKIAAAMTAGSPIAMASDSPEFLERVRRHRWSQAILARLERFLRRRAERRWVLPIGSMSLRIGFRHPRLARLIMSSPFAKVYLRPENMGREACGLFGTWAGGDVTLLHIAQTVRTVREGVLTSVCEEGRAPLDYSEGMVNITTPLAAAAGTKDFMPARDIKEQVLGAVSSEHTLFLPVRDCGHVDLLFNLPLPEIMSWMEWAST